MNLYKPSFDTSKGQKSKQAEIKWKPMQTKWIQN